MPETGKTTFLAAFWKSIQEARAQTALRLDRFPESAAYLEGIGEAWMQRKEVGHTPRDMGELIEIDLASDGERLTLEVPDVSGESFERMLLERQTADELDTLLVGADGLLLFLHPERLRPRVTIVEAVRMGANLTPDSQRAQTDRLAARRKMPAEVECVGLLQILRSRREDAARNKEQARVAVVISAWDLVESEGLNPAGWLAARAPMLHSYLRASSERTNWCVFGVSAQGESYENDDLVGVDPVERIKSVAPDGDHSSDLSLLITWTGGVA